MGLCLSVALWKEKLYADGGSRALPRGAGEVAGVKGGGRDYETLGGDALEVEEEKEKVVVVVAAAAAPAAMGVRRGAEAAAASGGTPPRPIWQRKVLMGVKCQLPRFSGMILYDESGRPACGGVRDEEKHSAAIAVLTGML